MKIYSKQVSPPPTETSGEANPTHSLFQSKWAGEKAEWGWYIKHRIHTMYCAMYLMLVLRKNYCDCNFCHCEFR